MITTTLQELRQKKACASGLAMLVASLGPAYGDETPITMIQILESNGLDHALWAPLPEPPEVMP